MTRFTPFLLTTFVSFVSVVSLPASAEILDHNGSRMHLDVASGTITYDRVKRSLVTIVKPGDMIFSGRINKEGPIEGTAFTFRKGCPPAPYAVTGYYDEALRGYIFRGAAPVRAKSGCNIIDYDSEGTNSKLIFKEEITAKSAGESDTPRAMKSVPTPVQAIQYLDVAFRCLNSFTEINKLSSYVTDHEFTGSEAEFSLITTTTIIAPPSPEEISKTVVRSDWNAIQRVSATQNKVTLECYGSTYCLSGALAIDLEFCDEATAQNASTAINVLRDATPR